ncbi:MAG: ADP-glyceromanno-heptose 6-epimerase [Bacteroidota bacterium]
MIVVTGAAGFIGSCLTARLLSDLHADLVLVDDFSPPAKQRNLEEKHPSLRIDRDLFLPWLSKCKNQVELVFHLGARTDTTELNPRIFDSLNLGFSQALWNACADAGIPLIYASSAATYGDGRHGYQDDHTCVPLLHPLNPYGVSKNTFDHWALRKSGLLPDPDNLAPAAPPFWAGLKFFNVYGPNEYHKSRMASVVFHTFRQIQTTGTMRLFRSHRPDVPDGHQQRDFIYVRDVVDILRFLQDNPSVPNGLYNVGTGSARTFLDLATLTFLAMDREPAIHFVDTPADIRHTYQYFTEADMRKLQQTGYAGPRYSLESGILEYVRDFLLPDKCW